MSAFPDWQKYAVRQKRDGTGCIATGYEMLLRAAGVEGIAFSTFQDDFDLDKDLKFGEKPRNDFESVAEAVNAKYPHVRFKKVGFAKGDGSSKLNAIEEMITKHKPVLISLALAPWNGSGWHIMPVVDSSGDFLLLLWGVNAAGILETRRLKKSQLVLIHDRFAGGDDIAFFEG